MAEWDRRTPWRQGHFLTADTIAALGLVDGAQLAQSVAIVASHDCDLAQDARQEPFVEVIVGQRIDGPNGNYTHSKNPRRLHLEAVEAGVAAYCELHALGRRSIPKADFAGHPPDGSWRISSPDNLSIFQHWLAARYRRAAFPDAFEDCLVQRGINRRIARILQRVNFAVIALFFDVDQGAEREHGDLEEDPFALSIIVLYSTQTDQAEDVAAGAAKDIAEVFRKQCRDEATNTWRGIELLDCSAISDLALTYAMSRVLKRWHVDYLSLRDPDQPMMSD